MIVPFLRKSVRRGSLSDRDLKCRPWAAPTLSPTSRDGLVQFRLRRPTGIILDDTILATEDEAWASFADPKRLGQPACHFKARHDLLQSAA